MTRLTVFSQRALLRWLLVLTLTCGLLDATAVWNTTSFGIGAYIAASGLCGALLILRSIRLDGEQATDGIPGYLVKPAVLAIALLWALASLQASRQIGSISTLITQTTVRTILIGHFLVCVLLIRIVDDQLYVRRILSVILLIYVSYGIYDFVAQVMHYPRFLDFMRNSNSLKVTESFGPQGWIRLPRLSSLAAEPSHTIMPIALATFVFVELSRFKRVLLLFLVVLFCAGTFARTVWIAYSGAICLSLTFWVLDIVLKTSRSRLRNSLPILAALILPILIVFVPLVTNVPHDADDSIMKRIDSSRTAVSLFADHPLVGVGFEGWRERPLGFTNQLMGPASVNYIHNGVALYLAALGVAGLFIAYLPLLIIVRATNLSFASKGWWIGIYSLSALGGDYWAMPSTWTAVAVAVCWSVTYNTEVH